LALAAARRPVVVEPQSLEPEVEFVEPDPSVSLDMDL